MALCDHPRRGVGSLAFARFLRPQRDGRVQPCELRLLCVDQHIRPHYLDLGHEPREEQWYRCNPAPRFEQRGKSRTDSESVARSHTRPDGNLGSDFAWTFVPLSCVVVDLRARTTILSAIRKSAMTSLTETSNRTINPCIWRRLCSFC